LKIIPDFDHTAAVHLPDWLSYCWCCPGDVLPFVTMVTVAALGAGIDSSESHQWTKHLIF
jgi:hypothetical protein